MDRGRFSDRMGLQKRRDALQLESLDDPLRAAIWNVIFVRLTHFRGLTENGVTVVRGVFRDVLNIPMDDAPSSEHLAAGWLKGCIIGKSLNWAIIYDIVEDVTMRFVKAYGDYALLDELNRALELEGSGYRFIEGRLAPITSPSEISAIEEAMSTSRARGIIGVHAHLDAALEALSQKPEPDYRNSIKESISAVEGAAKLISGKRSVGLAGALAELAKRSQIHGALVASFNSLYGY